MLFKRHALWQPPYRTITQWLAVLRLGGSPAGSVLSLQFIVADSRSTHRYCRLMPFGDDGSA